MNNTPASSVSPSARKGIFASFWRRGISLVEMAAFMTITGAMMMGGTKVYEAKDAYDRYQVTAQNLNLVKEAIDNYKKKNGRLPCVSSLSAAPDSASYGQSISSNCSTAPVDAGTQRATNSFGKNVRIGTIPTRELGLPDSAMIDGWGNRIVFAVTENWAVNSPTATEPGAVILQDPSGNPLSSDSGRVLYTVFSPGSDRRGAYNLNGQQVEPCDTGATAGANCNGDAVFVSTSKKSYSGSGKFTSLFAFGAEPAQVISDPGNATTPTDAGACTPNSSVQQIACQETPTADPVAAYGVGTYPAGSTYSAQTGGPYTAGAPAGTGFIIQRNDSYCPSGSSGWYNTFNSCCWAKRDFQTSTPCPARGGETLISGTIYEYRDFTCPARSWGAWTKWNDTCTYYQYQTVSCPAVGGYYFVGGQIDQRRTYVPYTGATGAWETTSNTCDYCGPYPAAEYQTLACPAVGGAVYTSGQIDQRRDYQCPSKSWGGWYTTSNTCTYCYPTYQTQTLGCPAVGGYYLMGGQIDQRRDYNCTYGVGGSWTGWYTTSNTCSYCGPYPAQQYQSVGCPAIGGMTNTGGSVTQRSDYQCPAQSWGGWYDVGNSCTYCTTCSATSQDSSQGCPAIGGQTNTGGYQAIRRNYTCSDSCNGSWGGWYVIADYCTYTPTCSATSQTQSVGCPAIGGMTNTGGSVTQQRDYTCPAGTWSGWYDIANSCTYSGNCSPTSETRPASCPAVGGQTNTGGSVTEQRDYTCLDATTGVWGGWYQASSSCTYCATCSGSSQSQSVACGTGYTGNKTQTRTYTCSDSCNGSWGGWVDTDTSGCVPDSPPGCTPDQTCDFYLDYYPDCGRYGNQDRVAIDCGSRPCPQFDNDKGTCPFVVEWSRDSGVSGTSDSGYAIGSINESIFWPVGDYRGSPNGDCSFTACNNYCSMNDFTITYCAN